MKVSFFLKVLNTKTDILKILTIEIEQNTKLSDQIHKW